MTKFFKVGGAVRDELMGLKPKDIDFAVECESFDTMREEILSRGGQIFLETPQFFTIRAKMPAFGAADFVLCRKDGAYKDGRRPESVTAGTILDDLARRDFTINAMARDCQTNELIDPHEGARDIQRKVIACVGNSLDRFNEDGLRVFRALRFAITKEFTIDSFARNAIDRFVLDNDGQKFDGVSTERIREELLKMFAKDSERAFNMLLDFGLWRVVAKRGLWLKPTTESK